jgi:hypothetical protein
MRFYTQAHASTAASICMPAGCISVSWIHKRRSCCTATFRAGPEAFLKAVEPYRQDLVVAVECIFSWYWLADLCAQEGIGFILGHALYMKALHGGQSQKRSNRLQKIAVLLRGGMIPVA